MSPEQVEDKYDSGGIAAAIVLCIFCPIIPIVLLLEHLDKRDRDIMERKRREKEKESYLKEQERSKDEKNI